MKDALPDLSGVTVGSFLADMKTIASERPEFIYGTGCGNCEYYLGPAPADESVQSRCIMGEYLHRFHGLDDDALRTLISGDAHHVFLEMGASEFVADYADDIQTYQDEGVEWGAAVTMAEAGASHD